MRMATAFSASSSSHHHNFFTYSNSKCFNSDSFPPLIYSPFHPLRRSAPIRLPSNSTTRPPRCLSSGPEPRLPSPSDSDPRRPPGFVGKLSRFRDVSQVFFAVLFWMSLFFWSSVWDGRNSGGPKKGSQFRR